MSEVRFDVIWAANKSNKLDQISDLANMPLHGILDDKSGMTIGYVHADYADNLVNLLNDCVEITN